LERTRWRVPLNLRGGGGVVGVVMPRVRRLALTTAAAVLASWLLGALPARAQARGYAAEIANIDLAEKRVTLKASMGQQTMRVAAGVALDALKRGDKVLVTFGQEGGESVIVDIEIVRP
jgi:Cu/Ag efflux protein CusF